jgi:hypothetical protein
MSDEWGNDYVIDAAHVYGSCGDDIYGNNAYVYGSDGSKVGEKVGEVINYDHVDDWALIELKDSAYASEIIDDNDDFPTVKGYVTESCLHDWESDDKHERPCLYNMGCTTGKTTGRLQHANCKETDWNDCVRYDSSGSPHGVMTWCNMGDGDSGGPTYHTDGGDAYLVSCTGVFYCTNSCYWDTCDGEFRKIGPDSMGIAGYQIQRENPYKYLP